MKLENNARYIATALGIPILMATLAFWTEPHLVAQIKAALVRDADNPALQPFVFGAGQNWSAASQINFFYLPAVPAGKRLVIEQVSVVAGIVTAPTQKLRVSVQTFVKNSSVDYSLVGTSQGQFGPMNGTHEQFVASSQMRSYSDEGRAPIIFVMRAETAGGASDYAGVSVSGYFVNVP